MFDLPGQGVEELENDEKTEYQFGGRLV